MPSSKGKPTDPKLREKVKKDVQQMEKGGGKGQWSAWKAGELARQYEAKGGDYEDSGDNPNEAKKGDPQPKKSAVEKGERKDKNAPVGEPKKQGGAAKKAAASKGSKASGGDSSKKAKSSTSADKTKKTTKSSSSTAKPKRAAAAASTRKTAAASA